MNGTVSIRHGLKADLDSPPKLIVVFLVVIIDFIGINGTNEFDTVAVNDDDSIVVVAYNNL